MNSKRKAWQQQQQAQWSIAPNLADKQAAEAIALDKAPLVLRAGQGMVQVSPTQVVSAPLSQIDLIKEGTIWVAYVNGVELMTFNNEEIAEHFSQQHANWLRQQGHRVFRTIQA